MTNNPEEIPMITGIIVGVFKMEEPGCKLFKKSHRLPGGFSSESDKVNYYLQFLHVQLSPQLQFSQVQPGLSHFCLSFGVV
jgi:hypothetical protein